MSNAKTLSATPAARRARARRLEARIIGIQAVQNEYSRVMANVERSLQTRRAEGGDNVAWLENHLAQISKEAKQHQRWLDGLNAQVRKLRGMTGSPGTAKIAA